MSLPLLFALYAGSPSAFAADAPPAADVTLASQAEVTAYVERVRGAAGAPVLLAAAGPEAERIALKAAETAPTGQVRVVRVGYIGDDHGEVQRALTAAGLACAVRIGATPAGTWTAATHGTCLPSGAPAAVATAHPTPKAPSVLAIPGMAAALPSPAAAPAPPSPASPPAALQPLAPPPPPDPAVLQSTYDTVALARFDVRTSRPDLPDGAWAVRDGRGRGLTALEFARRTGDLGAERRLQREATSAKSLSLGLSIGGTTLAVTGLGLLLARDAGAPAWSEFDPDIGTYDTNAEYFEALGQAEADYRAAQDAHAIRSDDRVWIAGFIAGAGVLALGASPFAVPGAEDRAREPALFWDRAEADALIAAHNASVRQRIGLPDPTPVKAVIVKSPPDDEDEEDDAGEDFEPVEAPDAEAPAPPADDRPAPPDDTPAPERAPSAPSGPSGFQHLRVTPVLGLTWSGLVGTF